MACMLPPVAEARPWVLLCKPVRAPFRDGTSVLVRNMLRAMPPERELIYFGDPAAPIRPVGDRVLPATAMGYQPSLRDKLSMLIQLLGPRLARVPIHSFFAANPNSSRALELLRRAPRRRAVIQTLPASTGAAASAGLLARLERVIVSSEWGRKQLLAAGLASDRVARVYPGVELPEGVATPALGERTSLLFAGDLDPDVGERLLVLARALARADGPWRLDIATRPKGEAHQRVRARLERELAPALAQGRVRLLGEVEDMNALLDDAALQLYLASHARKKVDIPFVLLEGMARGIPVAILDAEPVNELLAVAREQALEVGVSLNADAFPDSCVELLTVLTQPAHLTAMGAASRELVRARFSATQMAASYRRHYEELS